MIDHPSAPRSARRPLLPALAVLAAVAVGGCTATGEARAPSSAPAVPAASASVGAPAVPSAGGPSTIPASAFLEVPEDMRRFERKPAEGSEAVPKLCDGELAAGTGVAASAAMMSVYKQPGDPAEAVPHGVLFQTIRSYGGDDAAAFMTRLRDGLDDCTSYRDGEATVRVKDAPLPGAADEALAIDLIRPQLDLPGNPTGGEQTNRIVVMRFGAVVTVLYDGGYERSSSIPAIVDTFVREAARAIGTWRR